MRAILLALAATTALVSSALAADIAARPYTKAPAYAAPVYNWTGFYAGVHLGGAFGGDDGFSQGGFAPALVSSGNTGAFLGGGQIGADYQFAANWVIGIEGQISGLSSFNHTFSDGLPAGASVTYKTNWLASVAGRLGYTWGPGLIYAKGGVAFRDDNRAAVSAFVGPWNGTRDETGYTVGGGLEYLFARNWSAKVEYQYYNFGDSGVIVVAPPPAPFVTFRDDIHTVKVGVSYRFN